MKDLTQGKTSRVLLTFAFPLLIGNIFQLAYNLADTRIVGSFLGNDALASVGATSTLSDLMIGFLVGLTNGFSVVISRFFGMGNKEKVRTYFARALQYGLILAIVFTAVSLMFLPGIFRLLHISDAEWELGKAYISIILCGMTFSMLYNVFASGLRAIGDSMTPLFFLIFSACVNVGLDICFVAGLHMGVKGAALATVLSQALSAGLCFCYLWKKYPFLHIKRTDFGFSFTENREMLSCGISMGLMSSLVAFGTLALQSAINTLGTNTIVAHSAARKLTSLYMTPHSVLGMAMATYAGQNYGAGKMDRVKKGLYFSLGLSYAWVMVVQLMTYTICPSLIRMITDTQIEEVVNTAVLYLKVDTLFYVLVPTISIIRNTLQALGDQKLPVVSSGLELLGKVVIAFTLTPILKYWGIIIAEPIVWIIMVIPLLIGIHRKLFHKASLKKYDE